MNAIVAVRAQSRYCGNVDRHQGHWWGPDGSWFCYGVGPDDDLAPLPMPAVMTLLATPLTTSATGVQTLERQVGGRGSLLPTPTTRDVKGGNQRRDDTCLSGALLPTPRATDGTNGGPNQRGSTGDLMLPSAVQLLPTPMTEPLTGNGHGRNLGAEVKPAKWGEYGPAIRRWESVTRPAPAPTKPNGKGNPKLSDLFDEWLMGYPAGWITDVPGVTWNEALKACGNGVVWQQGSAAIRWLVTRAAA